MIVLAGIPNLIQKPLKAMRPSQTHFVRVLTCYFSSLRKSSYVLFSAVAGQSCVAWFSKPVLTMFQAYLRIRSGWVIFWKSSTLMAGSFTRNSSRSVCYLLPITMWAKRHIHLRSDGGVVRIDAFLGEK